MQLIQNHDTGVHRLVGHGTLNCFSHAIPVSTAVPYADVRGVIAVAGAAVALESFRGNSFAATDRFVQILCCGGPDTYSTTVVNITSTIAKSNRFGRYTFS